MGIFSVSFWPRVLKVRQPCYSWTTPFGSGATTRDVDSRESGHGLAAGCCEHGTEPPDDIAGEELPEQLRGRQTVSVTRWTLLGGQAK